jgi:hydroxymethylbilane synthase
VEAERACLAALGGGCHLALGALAQTAPGGRLRLRAFLAAADGTATRADVRGAARNPEALGRRAARELRASRRR